MQKPGHAPTLCSPSVLVFPLELGWIRMGLVGWIRVVGGQADVLVGVWGESRLDLGLAYRDQDPWVQLSSGRGKPPKAKKDGGKKNWARLEKLP